MNKTILDIADVQSIVPDLEATKLLARDIAETIQVIVFGIEKKQLKILTTNNFPNQLKQLIDSLTQKGYTVDLYYTDTEAFRYALTRYDQIEAEHQARLRAQEEQDKARGTSALTMIQRLVQKKDSMDPGNFIMEIIKLAFQSGASDLHFQSEERGIIIKVRIDGVLQEVVHFTHTEFVKYMQKLKFISGAKINVTNIPQDGRFSFIAKLGDKNVSVDARCSFMPGLYSENAVIRFLNTETGLKRLEELGFSEDNYKMIYQTIHKSSGLIIVSGPTGSGKTTTLYSMLSLINDGRKKIITLEDPIEYNLPGIEQSQINPTKGYTFEVGLKAILRHDPDIIMVGEIRTLETAEIVINAALTGHLVFTTLHTTSAIDAIVRLLSIGIKPYLLAPSLQLIVSQRLVRKLDPTSTIRRTASYAESAEIQDVIKTICQIRPDYTIHFDGTVPQAIPTESNNKTGYIGRLAIQEVLWPTEEMRSLITDAQSTITLYAKARENGFLTMKEDGIIKVLQGLTTLEEVRRVL